MSIIRNNAGRAQKSPNLPQIPEALSSFGVNCTNTDVQHINAVKE